MRKLILAVVGVGLVTGCSAPNTEDAAPQTSEDELSAQSRECVIDTLTFKLHDLDPHLARRPRREQIGGLPRLLTGRDRLLVHLLRAGAHHGAELRLQGHPLRREVTENSPGAASHR